MKKVIKIVNSWWFRSALAGVASVILAIYGNWFLAGISTGIGIRELLLTLKKESTDCPNNCEECSKDCVCKKQ